MSQKREFLQKVKIFGIFLDFSLDLRHPTEESRQFLKSLWKIIFKNSMRDSLALIWSIWPQSSLKQDR